MSVVGLGKLGSPLAACLAAKGHQVIGVDINESYVRSINKGCAPVREPGLDSLMYANRHRIRGTLDFREAIQGSTVSFVVVPTPSDERGSFSLKYVLPAVEAIGYALKEKDGFHLVVTTSTVMPGATQSEILPTLEKCSGKKCGKDFGLCYSPEFIALGSVIDNLLNPDFVLIGESDKRSGDILAQVYEWLCANKTPIARMNFVNAELTKLSVNTYVTTKIAYANMLAEVCEQIPGADVDVVTDALGLDSRIGRKYLKGATAYGGPCFPRDNHAFSWLARSLEVEPSIAEATEAINARQAVRIKDHLMAHLPHGSHIGILGLAYKPGTHIVEESASVALAKELVSCGCLVSAYDPKIQDLNEASNVLGQGITLAGSIKELIENAAGIVIALPCPEFKQIISQDFMVATPPRKIVIDCWRMLDRSRLEAVCEYIALGSGPLVAKDKLLVRESR
ncbi:MAG: UDP-glucose/GDP-mannose dehydrogenase family protein [Candidatus Melainabacteria bacterium]|nr:UDP-glucose/GDP-mannose dehydrogenase family protein [Candidatus Melainabacteria bacterium]